MPIAGLSGDGLDTVPERELAASFPHKKFYPLLLSEKAGRAGKVLFGNYSV